MFFFNYLILITSYSKVSTIAFTFTLSHFLEPNKAFQTGESFDIVGISDNIFASVEPTILYFSFSLVAIFFISIKAHIPIFSHLSFHSFIISTFFSCDSKSEILNST
ncbi:MAG: hypothetical protein P1U46_04665 [Patescibacteria group bacterium]|nr:hypothetical protein [Patescibacteria group bacterium]